MSEKKESLMGSVLSGKGLVLGSLAANIFLIGMVASSLLHPQLLPPPPFGGAPGRLPIERLMESLPREDADRLLKLYEETTSTMGSHHGEIVEASAKIATLLRQEKPDLQALQTEVDRLEAVGKGFHEKMRNVLRHVATDFSLETRKKIADSMEKGRFAFDLRGGPPHPRGAGPGQGTGMMPRPAPEGAPVEHEAP